MEENKVISIEQKKKETAILKVNGETIELDSFILSGINTNRNHIVLAHNLNIEEIVFQKELLHLFIQQKIVDVIEDL